MRAFVLLASVFLCVLDVGRSAESLFLTNTTGQPLAIMTNAQRVIVDVDVQEMIDSWAKGAATNGLVCAVSFAPSYGKPHPQPVFYVNVINTTTNVIRGFLTLPFEAFANIDLFDQQGKPVEKTAAGQRVGTWTQKQIDLFNREQDDKVGGNRLFALFPLLSVTVSNGINIARMFQLKEPGEYTLHLRMRLVQNKQDKSDKVYIETTWLPEVVAGVHIWPEDIQKQTP